MTLNLIDCWTIYNALTGIAVVYATRSEARVALRQGEVEGRVRKAQIRVF